jgi:hypothetical protein
MVDKQLLLFVGPGVFLPLWFLKNWFFPGPIKGGWLIASLSGYGLIAVAWAIVAIVYILFPGGHPPLAPLVLLAASALTVLLSVLTMVLCIASWVATKTFNPIYIDILLTNLVLFASCLYVSMYVR